jgi:indole-3-glycerol phosphate synthase
VSASVLDEILATTRADVARRRRAVPEAALEVAGERTPGAFRAALAAPGLAIIAEHKRRSPSAGAIRPGSSVAEIARAYERGGAVAMSVLTEERWFDGSLEDLREARRACALPLLRKDFVIDPYQLAEAASAGAAAVLLIVAALEPAQLRALRDDAAARGLDALVEVHDETELEVALGAGARIVGINNRDLRDFSVDVERTFALRELVPADVLVVSESGISTPAQLARLERSGVDAALVGESLMRADDPAQGLRGLIAAARSARPGLTARPAGTARGASRLS